MFCPICSEDPRLYGCELRAAPTDDRPFRFVAICHNPVWYLNELSLARLN